MRRVQIGLAALALIVVAGTVGYAVLGFGLLEALYLTVGTISTVGYGFPHPLGAAGKSFTIVLILVGVGTALYTFTVTLEVLIDGHMRDLVRRRRMERDIARMTDHVVICGWGRVGREVARYLDRAGQQIVVVDRDADRISTVDHPTVAGDVTDDETLLRAGIEAGRGLLAIAALDTDADNLFVTVSGRSFQPSIHVIARARSTTSEAKLLRVGADRVVNPQRLGGDRMAAFVTQPHVVDFVDVVMHDGSLEFRLEELRVGPDSPLHGMTLRSTRVHELHRRPGDRHPTSGRTFATNPSPETEVNAGDVLIGVGTSRCSARAGPQEVCASSSPDPSVEAYPHRSIATGQDCLQCRSVNSRSPGVGKQGERPALQHVRVHLTSAMHGPAGFTQRQAAGNSPGDVATAFIGQLEDAESEAQRLPPGRRRRSRPGATRRVGCLRGARSGASSSRMDRHRAQNRCEAGRPRRKSATEGCRE